MPDPAPDYMRDIEFHYNSCPIVGCSGCIPVVLIEAAVAANEGQVSDG